MYRFRYLNTQDLSSRTIDELSAMLSIAYGDLAGLEEYSLDRIRILIGIREITSEIGARTQKPSHPKPPTPGK